MSEQNPTAGGAVDKVAGRAKQAVGKLVGDQDLVDEGELQQAKAAQAKEAARLEAEADQATDEARTKAKLESNAVEQARVRAELDAAERLGDIERTERAEESHAESVADRRRQVLDRLEAAEEAALDRREQAIEADERLAESRVDEIERQAAEAEQVADGLDAAQKTVAGEG